ncbi:hypothetical protein GQ457_18G011020 [Hibiscus cannabinus]
MDLDLVFVRMSSKGDAERVIERFNGFWLYGSRVRVSMAQRERASFWRKEREDPLSQKQTTTIRYGKQPILDKKEFDGKGSSRRRVIGEVEEEKLEILRFCAVGYCRRQCSVLDLAKEYRAAGLEGFTVMRVLGSLVLLIFLNEDQRRSILDKDVLQQWLENVMEWSPGLQLPNRRVWLSAWGIPIHAWSEVTFKRIASLWEDLRAHFLIETDWFAHIDEMIELCLGEYVFPVRVVAFEEVVEQQCDCCCEKGVESDGISEAKVVADKNDKSTEMLETRDSSRVEESLRKASAEETVVPNFVSHGVDSVEMLERMWEGNKREDWRVLELPSVSRNWSNEEEAGLVNRFDNSPPNNDDIVPFETYSDVSSLVQRGVVGPKAECPRAKIATATILNNS